MIVRIKISITAIAVIEIFIPDFILAGSQNQNLDPPTSVSQCLSVGVFIITSLFVNRVSTNHFWLVINTHERESDESRRVLPISRS
jgi:hypothetical protein